MSSNEELLRTCSPEPGDNAGKQRKLVHGSSPGSPTPEEKTPQPPLTPSPLQPSMATPADGGAQAAAAAPPAAPKAKKPAGLPDFDESSSFMSPAKVEATQFAEDDASSSSSAASASAGPAAEAGEDSLLADLALQLSRQTASQASSVEVGVDGGAADDDEAASLALAMQMMQQEQALAGFYQDQGGAGFGFDTPEDSELGGALEGEQGNDWIPNEEVEAVEADDALAEEDVTYEQLVELDAQRVVVGITEEARGRTSTRTINEADIASLADDVHAKRCCICLCDYEAGEKLRELPCKHGCHMDCMDTHLAQSKVCPICRTEV